MDVKCYINESAVGSSDDLMTSRLAIELVKASINGIFDRPGGRVHINGLDLQRDGLGLYAVWPSPLQLASVGDLGEGLSLERVVITDELLTDDCRLALGRYFDPSSGSEAQAMLDRHPANEDLVTLTVMAPSLEAAFDLYSRVRSGTLPPQEAWTDRPAENTAQ